MKREAFLVGLQPPQRTRARRMRVGLWSLLLPAVLVLSSCSSQDKDEWQRLAMPEGVTDRTDYVHNLWQGAWIAALATGVLVWALIFYVSFRYRRRSDDEIPVQTRYNLPVEILYTIAPVVMVLVFFDFTLKAQNGVTDIESDPDHVVNVVGQQWSWAFNYVDDPALGGTSDEANCDPTTTSTCVYLVGTTEAPPTLYLPVDQSVRFNLSSPDVIHSFWVPQFNYKMDVVPGRGNFFTMTPTREGTYLGRCAELCGVYHSRMLFKVEVVSEAEYAAELEKLRDEGNTGLAMGGSEVNEQQGLQDQVQDDDVTGGN